MSEVITDPNVTPEPKDDLVSKKVVDSFKADMLKYKDQAKAYEAEIQKFKDQQALQEKEQLIAQEKWKDLYEKEKSEREKTASELKQKSEFFVNTSKINAVVQSLGGFKKDSYTKFINTSNIELTEDGNFSADSIAKEVDRIKQEYPELLNAGPSAGKMPANAPAAMGPKNTNDTSKLNSNDLAKLATQQLFKGK